VRQRHRDRALVCLRHKKLQGEQTRHVCLGFFDGAIEFFQLEPRVRVASTDFDLVRTKSVAEFMGHNVSEEKIKAQVFLRIRLSTTLDIGSRMVLNFAS